MVSPVEEYSTVEAVVREALTAAATDPAVETVPTRSSCGRVASEDLLADENVPPLGSSHMDGFAFRYSDLLLPRGLRVVGELGPGQRSGHRLKAGEAVRVATGSLIPEGADTVVPLEQAEVTGERVSPLTKLERGQFVYEAGEDLRKGDLVIQKGARVRPQDLGLLIAMGVPRLAVFVKPRVTLIATGDELTNSIDARGGRVRNSHVPLFARLIEQVGCEPVDGGIVPDDPRRMTASLRKALGSSDLVLTMGGTSVGKRDVVGDSVARLGPEVVFHGIRMDRGRVAGLAVVGGKPVVMMPGPIQGAMNAFLLLAMPFVRKLSGQSNVGLALPARLSHGWEARKRFPNFTKVIYVSLRATDRELVAKPMTAETESMTLLSRANAFVIVPEEVTAMAAGEMVTALMLPGFSF